jgi:hypothetical protein
MRVLWVDADENPFTDANGWRVLEDFGLRVQRVSSVAQAQAELPKKNFELLLIRAEMAGVPSFLVQARRALGKDGRRVVLTSSEWSKEQFRHHSKTDGAAHRYARVPMPPEGLLNLVAELFGCTVDELKDFDLGEEPAKPKKAKKAREMKESDAGDTEVLRKYLAIKEEQLEIAEGEREELSLENERLQKDAQLLQMKLREFEHMQDELEKKIEAMEEEKQEGERQRARGQEGVERDAKIQAERIKGLEAQISEANEKYENLKGRVRKDIRKIRENERDLEARLELMRKDSSTLLQARDEEVLELQRKIDALEFDLDQIQDSRVQAQMEAERYLAKLSRVSRALQIATSMIEDDRAGEAELEELEPLAGGAANAEAPSENAVPSEPPAAAEAPPAEEPKEEEALSPELAALATEGEATQMISPENLQKIGGDSGSS